jgi:hypothetical protein
MATKTKTKAPAKKAKAGKQPKASVEQAPEQAAATKTAPGAKQRKTPEAAADKKLSAIDAAAKVLGEGATGQALNCGELIEAMAKKGYWISPGGKTPASTLYASILRELKVRGAQARFRKTERGKFALNAQA